jgi:hypothetical protein
MEPKPGAFPPSRRLHFLKDSLLEDMEMQLRKWKCSLLEEMYIYSLKKTVHFLPQEDYIYAFPQEDCAFPPSISPGQSS